MENIQRPEMNLEKLKREVLKKISYTDRISMLQQTEQQLSFQIIKDGNLAYNNKQNEELLQKLLSNCDNLTGGNIKLEHFGDSTDPSKQGSRFVCTLDKNADSE